MIEGPILFSFVTKDYIKKCIENENLPIDDEPFEKAPDSLNDVKKDKIHLFKSINNINIVVSGGYPGGYTMVCFGSGISLTKKIDL